MSIAPFSGVFCFIMIGIYKITSPSNKIYIGQSVDIEKRWKRYSILDCKEQHRLYRSLKKYGAEKHKFEVICQCKIDELNEMERFYQDAFCSINDNGLNCKLTGTNERSGRLSDETKTKMSLSRMGRLVSIETRKKISKANTGKKLSLDHRAKLAASKKNMSIETKQKMSIAKKNMSQETRDKIAIASRNISIETREKFRANNIGKKASIETKLKMSESQKKSMTIERRLKMSKNSARKKCVICLISGKIFDSAKDAAVFIGYNEQTLRCMLNGSRKNKTSFTYA